MKYQRHLVVHNYTDHANSVCKDEDSSSASDWTNHRRQNAGGVKEPFPLKLHRMLQSEEEEEEENENHPTSGTCSSVVRWMPHGRAFIVLNPVSLDCMEQLCSSVRHVYRILILRICGTLL